MNQEDPYCQSCTPHQSLSEPQECSRPESADENYFLDEDKLFNALDPLAPSITAARADLLARIVLGLIAAVIVWHEFGALMTVLAFLYVYFFVPRLASNNLHLKSRTVRDVRPILTRSLVPGKHAGKKGIAVYYTCCTDNVSSTHLQREFDDMVVAVLQSCSQRNLCFAEITAELPVKKSLFLPNRLAPVARSAQFELEAQHWKPVETLIPEKT